MVLKGECEKEFLKWFSLSENREIVANICKVGWGESIIAQFHSLPDPMKWGVFVDFFDSEGIHPSVDPMVDIEPSFKPLYFGKVKLKNTIICTGGYDMASEARISVINEACELFNSREK